jgi:hypothetical protein
MSKISTVYASLVSSVGSLFPSKIRMHNPYNLDNNPDICKKDSWGLRVENAENVVSEFCNLTLNRTFTVVLMRQFVTLSSKEDGFDAVSIGLLEDQQSVASLVSSTSELGQDSLIDSINILSISGIQEMVSDEKKYLFSEVTFNISISELIS